MDPLRHMIRQLVSEAIVTQHFNDRVEERLFDPYNITPETDFSMLKPSIELVKKVNFPGILNIAVKIFRSGTMFTSTVKEKERMPSVGNNIWIIVRQNQLESVIFTPDNVVPQNTQYQMSVARIKTIVEERGSYNLTQADLESKKPNAPQAKAYQLDLPIVTIEGKKWYVDENKEVFLYVKNTKKTMSFDDAFQTIPDEEMERVMDQISNKAA